MQLKNLRTKKNQFFKKQRILERAIPIKKSELNPNYQKNERLLVSKGDTEMGVEIFAKRLPLYKVDDYRAFYSSEIGGLNPLRDHKLVKFEDIDVGDLLKKQYRESMGEPLHPSVM